MKPVASHGELITNIVNSCLAQCRDCPEQLGDLWYLLHKLGDRVEDAQYDLARKIYAEPSKKYPFITSNIYGASKDDC